MNEPDIVLANFDEMEEIAAEFDRAYAGMVGELADLETDLKQLETWQGSAKDVYLNAKKQWNDAVVAMGDTMQKFAPTLTDAADIMREAERANMIRWST